MPIPNMGTVFWTQLLPWVFYFIGIEFEHILFISLSLAILNTLYNTCIIKLLTGNGINVNERKKTDNSIKLHDAIFWSNLFFILFFFLSLKVTI